MKTTSSLLCAALCGLLLAVVATTPALAQASAATPAPVADDSSLTTFVSIGLALVTSLIAIWKNKQASTSRKIVESIVVGVEEATKLPQVRDAEKRVKDTIRAKATELGVEPLLNRVVKDLT